jgi:hypothetical protein
MEKAVLGLASMILGFVFQISALRFGPRPWPR